MTFKRKAVPFDTFVGGCNYFDGNSDVNNGYGCTHPEQEEKQNEEGIGRLFFRQRRNGKAGEDHSRRYGRRAL